jgi:large subunit ribosomal protein L24
MEMERRSPAVDIKKNDVVMVIAGKDKGKSGRVISVFPQKERVLVEKVNFVKRHTRPRGQAHKGGILERESPLHISNVMIVCSKCDRPVRVRRLKLQDGSRVRICHKCGESLD